MASVFRKLKKAGHFKNSPAFMPETSYEVMMGSVAYGVSSDTSDMDVYAFTIPPPEYLFPHKLGWVNGFMHPPKKFEQFQEHHINHNGQEYDVVTFNIAKYFWLCSECNPNMIDSLFVPNRCILYRDKIGNMVRDKRQIFLHKEAWHKLKGYAYGQLCKIETKDPKADSKRLESIQKYGYDVKYAYHIVRLLDEVEQLLVTGDIDLEHDRERLKSIRRGEWELKRVKDFFEQKEKQLEEAYSKSTLPAVPDIAAINSLLLDCLEEKYGDLKSLAIKSTNKSDTAIKQIISVLSTNNFI